MNILSLKKMSKDLKKNQKKKNAFTLAEIVVVILMIGILFMVVQSKIGNMTDKAKETGVKSDFRSFSIAAEQLERENSGLGKHETLDKLCAADGGINLYLDSALQFDTSGKCAQKDAWNQAYTVQVSATAGTNNGAVIFLSGGQDGSLNGTGDYAIATIWIDGETHTATSGFSSNIEETNFGAANIEAGSATAFDAAARKVTYAK